MCFASTKVLRVSLTRNEREPRSGHLNEEGQTAFSQPGLCHRMSFRSWWAKGDLNPHVPKDTGT